MEIIPTKIKWNTCPFCIVFQVLKLLLIKNFKIQPSDLFIFVFFLLAFTSADIIFHNLLQLHSTLIEKKIFVRNLSFLTDSLNPPPCQSLNDQNPLCMTKVFVDAPLTKKGKNEKSEYACTQSIQWILHIQISLSTKFHFKACVRYFWSNYYFSPNDSPLNTMKNIFYFI